MADNYECGQCGTLSEERICPLCENATCPRCLFVAPAAMHMFGCPDCRPLEVADKILQYVLRLDGACIKGAMGINQQRVLYQLEQAIVALRKVRSVA